MKSAQGTQRPPAAYESCGRAVEGAAWRAQAPYWGT